MVEFPKIKIEDQEWYIDRDNGVLISVKEPTQRIELASSGDAIALVDLVEGNHSDCSIWLRRNGRLSPRTCRRCGLGPCAYFAHRATLSPMETGFTRDELNEVRLARSFLQEALEKYRDVCKSSEASGQGLYEYMLNTGFVAWIDDQLHDIAQQLRPRATLADCIAAAKDRVLTAIIELASNPRPESRARIASFAALLAMPDTAPETLHSLYSADFWAGITDSFWDTARPPLELPAGILHQLMQVESPNAD